MAKSKAVVKKEVEGEVDILTPEQQKIIDNAVAFINKKHNSSCKNLIEIGAHLLKNFYNDDPELAKSKGRKKEGVSLRRLAIRPDLNVSIATLSRAFNLAIQEKLLVEIESGTLSESHKILLLHIDDPTQKVDYANKIVTESLSCRDFTKLLIDNGFILPRGLSSPIRKHIASKTQSSFDIFIEPLESIINFEVEDFDFSKFSGTENAEFVESVKKAKIVIDKLFSAITKQV